MTFARTVAGLVFCLGLAACTSQEVAGNWASDPPCPNVVSEREAVRIAKELARPEIEQYDAAVSHVAWNEAIWRVFLVDSGGRAGAIVMVRADGRVIGCDMHVECEPDPGLDKPACEAAAGDLIDWQEAAEIAVDYFKRAKPASATMRMSTVFLFSAHWRVSINPRGPAPVDSDFVVYVSADGSQTELTYPVDGPPRDSFLYRTLTPD